MHTIVTVVATGKNCVAQNKATSVIRFSTLIGGNKHAKRRQMSLLGYHLTVQEFTGAVAFLLVTAAKYILVCLVFYFFKCTYMFTVIAFMICH